MGCNDSVGGVAAFVFNGHTHVFIWLDRSIAEGVLFPEICRQASTGEITWFFAAQIISNIRGVLT